MSGKEQAVPKPRPENKEKQPISEEKLIAELVGIYKNGKIDPRVFNSLDIWKKVWAALEFGKKQGFLENIVWRIQWAGWPMDKPHLQSRQYCKQLFSTGEDLIAFSRYVKENVKELNKSTERGNCREIDGWESGLWLAICIYFNSASYEEFQKLCPKKQEDLVSLVEGSKYGRDRVISHLSSYNTPSSQPFYGWRKLFSSEEEFEEFRTRYSPPAPSKGVWDRLSSSFAGLFKSSTEKEMKEVVRPKPAGVAEGEQGNRVAGGVPTTQPGMWTASSITTRDSQNPGGSEVVASSSNSTTTRDSQTSDNGGAGILPASQPHSDSGADADKSGPSTR